MAKLKDLYRIFLNQKQRIAIDSRKITPGCIFFALPGEHTDGHLFIREAFNKGAAYAIISDSNYIINENCIEVEDPLSTLQDLARHHRHQLDIPFVAITGSSGKTSTKELTNAVLSTQYKVVAPQLNYNNHIGVPLTILNVTHQTEIAIIEMGANHIEEIDFLCHLSDPTHGVVTNIGEVHLEGFGSLAGVMAGKSELYHYLSENDGIVFLNTQMPYLQEMAKGLNLEVITYPEKNSFCPSKLIEAKPYVIFQDEYGQGVPTNLIGNYHFHNIATALCIGKYFEVPFERMHEAIQRYLPQNNRSEVLKEGTNIILLDAYNANQASMEATIKAFHQMPAEKRCMILGDMEELNDKSASAHETITKLVTQYPNTQAIFCGPMFYSQQRFLKKAKFFSNKQDLVQYLKLHPFKDTNLLLKASRKWQLESLVPLLSSEKTEIPTN